MAHANVIVVCRCAGRSILPPGRVDAVVEALARYNADVRIVDDLCAAVARHHATVRQWLVGEPVAVVACFPRAVHWLAAAMGAVVGVSTRLLNLRTQEPDEILSRLDLPAGDATVAQINAVEPGWSPWFPAIDYDRCIGCGQCRNFCLFGVYSRSDDGRVRVSEPARCKNNCPACARICPAAAIIFPRYPSAPINGDDVRGEDLKRECIGNQVVGLEGPALMAALRQRAAQLSASLQQSSPARADTGDIPVNITPASIQAILAAARQKDAGSSDEKRDNVRE